MKNRNQKQIVQHDQYSDSEISGVNSMNSDSFISDEGQQNNNKQYQNQKQQNQRFLNNDDYGPDVTPDISEDSYEQERRQPSNQKNKNNNKQQRQDYSPDITPDISEDSYKQERQYGNNNQSPEISDDSYQQERQYGNNMSPQISEDSYKQQKQYKDDVSPNMSKSDDYGPDITPDISRGNINKYNDENYGPDITPDISDGDYQNDEQLLGDLDEGGLVDNDYNSNRQSQNNLELNLSSTFDQHQQNLRPDNSKKDFKKSIDNLRISQGSQGFLKKNKSGKGSTTSIRSHSKNQRENITQKSEYDFDNMDNLKNESEQKDDILNEENLFFDEKNNFAKQNEIKVSQPAKIQIQDVDEHDEQKQDRTEGLRTSNNNLQLPKKEERKRSKSKKPFQRKGLSPKNLKDIKELRKLHKLQKSGNNNLDHEEGNSDLENNQIENQMEMPKNENKQLIKKRPQLRPKKEEIQLMDQDDEEMEQVQKKSKQNMEDFASVDKQNEQQKKVEKKDKQENQIQEQENQKQQQKSIQNFEKSIEKKEDETDNNKKHIKKNESVENVLQSNKKVEKEPQSDISMDKKIEKQKDIQEINSNDQKSDKGQTKTQDMQEKIQEQPENQLKTEKQSNVQKNTSQDQNTKNQEEQKKDKQQDEQILQQEIQKKQKAEIQQQQPEEQILPKKDDQTEKDKQNEKQEKTQKQVNIEQKEILQSQNEEKIDTEVQQSDNKEQQQEGLNDDLMTFDFKKPTKKKPKLNSRFKRKKQDAQANEDEILVPEKKTNQNENQEKEEDKIQDKIIEEKDNKKNQKIPSTKIENKTNQNIKSKKDLKNEIEKQDFDDEKPIKTTKNDEIIDKPKIQENEQISHLKTTKQNLDQLEQPKKPAQINNIQMDEQPIKPAQQPNEEQPLNTEQPPEQPIQNKPNPFSAEALANHPDAFPADELDPTKANLEDLGEIPDTLETRLKSREFKQRVEAYKELKKWEDPDMTPENFFKTLHLTIKEKHQNVIPPMLDAILSALQDPDKKEQALAALNLPKFISTFCEHTINNAKKPGAKKAVKEFIGKFYDAVEDKSAIIEEIKTTGKSFSPKVQEPVLHLIEQLLAQDKIKELDVIMSLTELVGKLAASRSKKIISTAMNVIKEMALYFGEGVKDFFKELKKEQTKELTDYLKDLDPKKMKALGGGDDEGQDIQAKLYEMAKEQDLPAEFADDQFTDAILEMPKWKDKQDAMQKLAAALKPIQKLNPKTKIFHIVTLVKQMFQQSIVILQVESLKPVQFLCNSLRKNMKHEAKDIFDTMMKNFQTRTRNLNDEITKTTLKLFNCFDLADIYDILKTSLKKTKSNFKKYNIINLIKSIVDKTNQVDSGETAQKVVKLVLPDIEFNDNKVREKVAQIIAKMKDKYNEKVQPLLSDLNPQKMKIILKFCTNPMFKQDDKDKAGEGDDQQQQKDNKDGDQQTQIGKTKSQKIANMRENLFSNKTYKISDTANFAKYLEVNLKQLGDITKDFKEVNESQAKEIYILIEEISKKVSKQAFTQVSREIIAKFYIELITQKYNEEIYDSIQEYLSSKNKIITTRIFLNDLFDVITMKNIKVTRDLLSVIIRLMIDKLRNKGNLNSISHKNFVDFLKNNFASQTLHASVKTIIVNLMRTLQKKYGERALSDYPASILKDFETQNKEIEKNFNRTLEKLNDKSEDKRTTALNEIANFKDIAKIVLFWTAKPFQQYLRTALIETTKEDTFKVLTMIVGSYLELYEKARNEFSIRNYLYVFQIIIKKYYDQSLDQNKASIDQIFMKSVEILSPTMILNNMVSDSNSMSWKEEIFHFYLQYGNEVNIQVKFINFIVQVISSSKSNSVEIKTLIDNVLLMLKSIDNDEIIIKGNENKLIREVWQKKEEDVLFEQRFVKSYKVFEDVSFFNSAKIFIDQSLHFQNYEFFDKDITQIVLEPHDPQLKIKLAYYYLRSVENISFINEHIFNQIAQLDSNTQKKDNIYIILKILFNLLRNNAAAYEEDFYMDVKDYFTQYFNQNQETPEELQKNLSLTGYDYRFLNVILQSLEDQQIERSFIGSPRGQNYNSLNNTSNFNNQTPGPYRRGMDDDTSYIQEKMNDNISNNTPIQFGKNKMNSQYISQLSIHPRENSPNKSKVSYGTNGRFNQAGLQTPRMDTEDFQELNIQIQNMLTFNFENFQLANKYFETEMKQNKAFLCEHSKFIIDNFISILIEVFGDGINFSVSRDNYQLIFNPLQTFCSDKDFLNSLEQQVANQFIREILCRLVDANEQKNYIQKFPDQAYQDEDEDEQLSPLEKAELASFLMKSFNSLMLKVISRLEINTLITSLFTFIFECLKTECVEPNDQLYELAFKCLLKIFKDFKKYQNQLDPRVVFSLVAEFLEIYNPQSGYKDNIKTIEMMLKKIMIHNQMDFITQCYHDVFGDHTVGFIWDLIMYFRQNQQQQPMMSPQEAHERLIEQIQIINSQNDFSQLGFFANQIGQILRMCPQINFLNYAGQFADGNFFEYLANQLGLNKNMSYMNSMQNSRSNLYNDQSFMTSQNVSRY